MFLRSIISALFLTSLSAFASDITVKINGMVCAFCAQGIHKSFSAQESVKDLKVSLETKTIDINLKEGKALDDGKIKKLITEAGYDVVSIKRDQK